MAEQGSAAFDHRIEAIDAALALDSGMIDIRTRYQQHQGAGQGESANQVQGWDRVHTVR